MLSQKNVNTLIEDRIEDLEARGVLCWTATRASQGRPNTFEEVPISVAPDDLTMRQAHDLQDYWMVKGDRCRLNEKDWLVAVYWVDLLAIIIMAAEAAELAEDAPMIDGIRERMAWLASRAAAGGTVQ
jgi:hypothetical protein